MIHSERMFYMMAILMLLDYAKSDCAPIAVCENNSQIMQSRDNRCSSTVCERKVAIQDKLPDIIQKEIKSFNPTNCSRINIRKAVKEKAGTNEDSPLDPFNIQCTNRRNRTTKITVSFNYAVNPFCKGICSDFDTAIPILIHISNDSETNNTVFCIRYCEKRNEEDTPNNSADIFVGVSIVILILLAVTIIVLISTICYFKKKVLAKLNSANLAAATTTANTIYEFGVHDYEDPDGQNITNCNESYLQSLTHVVDKNQVFEIVYGAVPTLEERENSKEMENNEVTKVKGTTPVTYHHLYEVGSSYTIDSYTKPASTEYELYLQMSKWNFHEIPRSIIHLTGKIGEGQFGDVYIAQLKSEYLMEDSEVAVKMMGEENTEEDKTINLLKEAATMGQFKHAHIVRLLGVVTIEHPKMIIMELLSKGDLRKYLLHLKEKETKLLSSDMAPYQLLAFCRQVADGLAYLSHKGFVHRDIAARNILLDGALNCKISDFGMARDLTYGYYVTQGGQIPVKWTAPEALLYRKYSPASDVWSYGMLMFEIWSIGHKPFEDITSQEYIDMAGDGYCHPPPTGCPRNVYTVMVQCWNPDYHQRPSAAEIRTTLCKSELFLFSWENENVSTSSKAKILGSPLEESKDLFEDLQTIYTTHT